MADPVGARRAAPSGAGTGGRRDADGPSVGEVFDGKYLVLRQLGQGGFGAVYEARDLALNVTVAIKLLRSDVAADEAERLALREEVRQLTRLRHPNIVDWKAFSMTADGTPYFVMEHLQGESLASLLAREGALPPARVIPILLQILDALRAAHQPGAGEPILHLDLKPDNVLLVPHPSGGGGDFVKLIDFGLGQFAAHEAPTPSEDTDGARVSDETIRNALVAAEEQTVRVERVAGGVPRVRSCTPNYAAPELGAHMLPDVEPVALDQRCDIYSVGVIAFRMLAGCLPFAGGSRYQELLRQKLAHDPPRLQDIHRGVPRRLAAFVDRCLSRDRAARFATTDEAYRALQRIATAPRRRRIAAGIGGAAAAGAGLVWLLVADAVPQFAVYAVQSGVEFDARRGPLYMGPPPSRLVLRPIGIEPGGRPEVRCVAAPAADAEGVPWLAARWSADGRIELSAAEAVQTRQTATVHLEVAAAGGPRWSEAFSVVLLPDASGAIRAVEVPGLDGRALDPQGQMLRIALAFAPEDVARVEVTAPGGAGVLAQPVSDPSGTVYELPVDRLGLPGGPAELVVTAVDRAGGQARRTFSCNVMAEPLRALRCQLEGAPFGGRTVLSSTQAKLHVELNGVADVTWTVRHEDRSTIAQGHRSGAARLVIDLGIDSDRDFEGSVEVHAADARWVLRRSPAERGTVEASLPFSHVRGPAALSVHAGKSAATHELSEDRPLHVASERVVLRVARQSAVPTRVVGSRLTADGAVPLFEARLDTRIEEVWERPVVLPPGEHDLEFQAFRILDGTALPAPPTVLRARVVVDVQPPRVRPRRDHVVLLADGFRGEPGVFVEEEPPGAIRCVRWQLRAEAADQILAAGEIAGDAAGHALPATALPELPDGDYALVFRAEDIAGNESEPVPVPLTVAARGPLVNVLLPSGDGPWLAHPDGTLPIEVRALDPNGVRSVVCEIDVPPRAVRRVPLTADARPAAGVGSWSGRVRADPSWGQRDLAVRIVATDIHGNETVVRTVQATGTITWAAPERVRLAVGGAELGTMVLVRGNRSGPYVFGGRGDEIEAQSFRESGLPAFNPLTVTRSWQIRFEQGAIADYYLDEHEVTTAQFARFLHAADGWDDAAHWLPGSRPDGARRARLAERVAAGAPDLPMTGVTWDEAWAFAAWSGRRLATFVEWEYAARGGLAYRATTCPPPGPGRTASANVNVGAGAGARPWPVHAGDDIAADSGIRNLCSNVAEWTQSPAHERGLAAGLRATRASLCLDVLAPDELARASEFWIAGPSFHDPSPGFATADSRPRSWSGEHVGFRCAAAASALCEAILQAGEGRTTYEVLR